MQACGGICSGFGHLIHKVIPFVTPAALQYDNRFKPDETTRVTRVFALFLAGSLLAFAALIISPWAYAVTILTTGVLAYREWQRANQAADNNAVQEYMTATLPSHLATHRIRESIKAAQMLVSKKADLNRPDDRGEGLLSIGNKRVVQVLLKGGACVKRPIISEHSSENERKLEKLNVEAGYGVKTFFHQAVAAAKFEFINAIFENISVQPSDYTCDQQYSFWVHVGTREAASLLKAYGFDPNIANSKGDTALNFVQRLLSPGPPTPFEEGGLTWREREAFLKAASNN
jgi:hypothetical protein